MDRRQDKLLKKLTEAYQQMNEESSIINSIGSDLGRIAHKRMGMAHDAEVEDKGKQTKKNIALMVKNAISRNIKYNNPHSSIVYIKTDRGEILLQPLSFGYSEDTSDIKYYRIIDGQSDSGNVTPSRISSAIVGNIENVKLITGSGDDKKYSRQSARDRDEENMDDIIQAILVPHNKVIKKYAMKFLKERGAELQSIITDLDADPEKQNELLALVQNLKQVAKNGWEAVSSEFFDKESDMSGDGRVLGTDEDGKMNLVKVGDLSQKEKLDVARSFTKKFIDILRSGDFEKIRRAGLSNRSVLRRSSDTDLPSALKKRSSTY